MPQLDFYSTLRDNKDIVSYILSLGLSIAPDISYAHPATVFVRDLSDFCKLRLKATQFFLVDVARQVSPLEMFEIASGFESGKYAVRQRHGGPYLRLSLTHERVIDGCTEVGAGSLSYYATFVNTDSGKQEKMPQYIRQYFRSIAAKIKHSGHVVVFECLDGGDRAFHLLPDVMEELSKGARLAGTFFEGLKVKGLDEYPKALGSRRQLPIGFGR